MRWSRVRRVLTSCLLCGVTSGFFLGAGHGDPANARRSRSSSPPASAGGARSLDCPGGIVALGASAADVRARCGEPSRRSPQIWVYEMGREALVRILRFERGRLAEIRHGTYGS